MEQKIVILGAKGMLGQALANAFADLKPDLLDAKELDITDQTAVEAKLKQLNPSVIINAAAYTDVDGAEDKSNEDLATKVNGRAVGHLAQVAKALGAVLVHFSTDYVFMGDNPNGYEINDKPDPINAYGRSKLKGEQELKDKAGDYYLIRTSWLYGPGGKHFVDAILTKAQSTGSLRVVNDQFGRPTYTLDLAQRIRQMIEQKKPFGTYHLTNATGSQGISWFEFASKAIELKGLDTKVVACSSDEFPRPAKRPKYSMLNSSKPLRDWQPALADHLLQHLN